MADSTLDGFLGGRLRIAQPRRGYRAGMDAVLLAAACPARHGDAVLDLGCGVGTALLCVGARVPGTRRSGVERDPAAAALAAQNAARNGIAADIACADIAALPADWRARLWDHAIANPPYFAAGPAAPDPARAAARHRDLPLADWVAAGLRRLRPGGTLTVIQPAAALADLLAALAGPAGAIAVLPLAPRDGAPAGRVIVRGVKGARAPLRLMAPLVLHGGAASGAGHAALTPMAQAILRDAAPINPG